MQGFGFLVLNFGFLVLKNMAQTHLLGKRFQGVEFKNQGVGFRVLGFGFRV